MNTALKWRLAVGVLVVFVAGIATGVFASAWRFHQHAGRGHADALGERMRHHLQTQLGLNAEQVEKINPVIDQTAERLNAVRRETGRRVNEIMEQSRRDLAPNLTAEQLARLDQMRARHHRRMRQHHGWMNALPDRGDQLSR